MFYCKAQFDGKEIVKNFIQRYKLLPHQELIYGYDEDDTDRLYITYDMDNIDELDGIPYRSNVWCFDKKTGKRLWVIQPSPWEESTYSGAGIRSDGILRASTSESFTFDLDRETGQISNPIWTK